MIISTQSLEASLIERSPMGVTEHDALPGGWSAIVARKANKSRVLYFPTSEDPRITSALRNVAQKWIAA